MERDRHTPTPSANMKAIALGRLRNVSRGLGLRALVLQGLLDEGDKRCGTFFFGSAIKEPVLGIEVTRHDISDGSLRNVRSRRSVGSSDRAPDRSSVAQGANCANADAAAGPPKP